MPPWGLLLSESVPVYLGSTLRHKSRKTKMSTPAGPGSCAPLTTLAGARVWEGASPMATNPSDATIPAAMPAGRELDRLTPRFVDPVFEGIYDRVLPIDPVEHPRGGSSGGTGHPTRRAGPEGARPRARSAEAEAQLTYRFDVAIPLQ
jgi:hypothetical protein